MIVTYATYVRCIIVSIGLLEADYVEDHRYEEDIDG